MEEELIKRFLDLPLPPLIGNLLLIVLVGMALVDWYKGVPYQPIRHFLRWIGDQTTKGISDKVDALKSDVQNVREELDDHIRSQDDATAETLRARILSFASSVERGESHSKSEYENIVRLHDQYLDICARIGKQNGFTELEYDHIVKSYNDEFEKGNFYD